MNIVEGFEKVKKFITKIRRENQALKSTTLVINANKFIDKDELDAIYHFDATIKKMCKLENIIYITSDEDEMIAFSKK